MKNLRNVGMIITVVGALVTLGIMASTTSAAGSLTDILITSGFYVWVVLPFIILIVLTSIIHRKALAPASRVAIFLTSVLVVISSVAVYWAAIFDSASSTSALVFIFIPVFSLVGIGVAYGLARLLLGSLMTKAQ